MRRSRWFAGGSDRKRRHFNCACIGGLLLFAVCWLGCIAHRSPQAALDEATHTFQQGDLVRAQKQAEQGYRDYHATGLDWAWNFRLLQANVLLWQGRSDRALEVLISEPAPPSSGELAVQRLRLEGLAYNSSNKLQEGEHSLSEAERLCRASDYPACALVVSARGGQLSRGAATLRASAHLGSSTGGPIS
jgi:hypothetical protein